MSRFDYGHASVWLHCVSWLVVWHFITSGISCSPLHVQDGLTALVIACFKGHDQIVEFLLRREADVNHHTKVRLLNVSVRAPPLLHFVLYCLKQAPMNTCSLSKNRE